MPNLSGLPPELEAKRLQAAKAYNKVALLNLFVAMGLLVALPFLVMRFGQLAAAVYLLLVVLPGMAAGLYLAVKRGDAYCREIGLLCPHCHQPLFEARSTAYLTGSCPKCRARVASVQ